MLCEHCCGIYTKVVINFVIAQTKTRQPGDHALSRKKNGRFNFACRIGRCLQASGKFSVEKCGYIFPNERV